MVVIKRKQGENIKEDSMNGEGALIDLVIKGLTHLVPALASSLGSRAGESIGNEINELVKKQIKKIKGSDEEQTGTGIVNGKIVTASSSRSKKGNKGLVSEFGNPEIVPFAEKKMKGSGDIVLRAMSNSNISKPKKERKQRGKGTKPAGKQDGGKCLIVAEKGKKQCGKGTKPSGLVGGECGCKKGDGFNVAGKSNPSPKRRLTKKQKEEMQNGEGMSCQNGEGACVSESMVKNLFHKTVRDVVDKLGDKATNSIELNLLGKEMFGKKFVGVFPVDKITSAKSKKYSIVNLDSSDQPGSHWISVCNGHIYDSFGRRASEMNKRFTKLGLINSNPNREQSYNEKTCGPHSLAAINVYDVFGKDAFKFI